MELQCPKCRKKISDADVNVGADTAFCRGCSEAYKLSELVHPEISQDFELDNPPTGAWFDQVDDNEFIVGARTRSGAGCFLIPFTIAWSGISIGGIVGSQVATGQLQPILCLFGIPFLVVSVVLWIFCLMLIWGITVVKVERGYGRLFTGIGSLGITRRFDWHEVTAVQEETYSAGNDGGLRTRLVLKADRDIRFGRLLSEERRCYVLNALRKLLQERKD